MVRLADDQSRFHCRDDGVEVVLPWIATEAEDHPEAPLIIHNTNHLE